MQCKCGKLPMDCDFFQNQYDCEGPERIVPRMDDHQNEKPLHPRLEKRLEWMETESKFAHACPDLDQELKHCPRNEGEPCFRPCPEHKDCFLLGTAAPKSSLPTEITVPDDILTTTFAPIEDLMPKDAAARKAIPLCRGLLDYFPDACAAVAEVSRVGNEQHNPGEPMHWARGKSMDQEDCIVRHLIDRGKIDSDGLRHSAKVAWRALALLQLELEALTKDPVQGNR